MEKSSVFSDKRTVKRIFCTILIMALVAAFIACIIISIANDIYAFIKPEGSVLFDLDAPLSLSDFSALLEDRGIISDPHVFVLYVRSKGKVELIEGFCGEAELDRSMSYREILLALSSTD